MNIFNKILAMTVATSISIPAYANISIPKTSVDGKQDLVVLFKFFEDNCGFDDNYQQVNSVSKTEYKKFVNSFVGYSDHYYLKPLSSVPSKYRKFIKDIELVGRAEDSLRYYVTFKNATYRGYNLDKLEVYLIPHSEYDYFDHLYFKDSSFLKLKPRFKFYGDGFQQSEFDEGFNKQKRSITCSGTALQ